MSVALQNPCLLALCAGVPLITLIIAAAGGALGDAGNWCWIKEGYDGYRFTLYFTPLLLVLLFNTVRARVAHHHPPRCARRSGAWTSAATCCGLV